MARITPENLETMLRAYVGAALWSSTDDDGEPMDAGRDISDIAPDTLAGMRDDCETFANANASDIQAARDSGVYVAGERYGYSQVGHDFWLTRNGHGAGFWDRGLGDIGERLSAAARACGEVNLFVNDDGKVYQE